MGEKKRLQQRRMRDVRPRGAAPKEARPALCGPGGQSSKLPGTADELVEAELDAADEEEAFDALPLSEQAKFLRHRERHFTPPCGLSAP